MDIPPGVGQVEVEIAHVHGGFPSRHVEYLASQFDLINRIRGDNNENLEYIKSMTGVRLLAHELTGKEGVSIQIQHPTLEGMKQGYENVDGLLEQVTSDFDTMRELNGISDSEWKLQYGIKCCMCPECGRRKNNLKDLEQHNNKHVSEKYDTMMIKISGASSGVRRSGVESVLGEFGSVSYVDMESHPRDIYVKFVRPVAVEKVVAHRRGKLTIDGKQVQVTRVKIGEVEDLRETLSRERRKSEYDNTKETDVFIPFQSEREWAVEKFVKVTNETVKSFHPTRIYVRGFPKETDRRELKEFFNQFGRVEEVKIKDPGHSKAYGFVEFRTKKALEKILGNKDVAYLPFGGTQLVIKRVAVNKTDEGQLPDMSDIQPETVRQVYVEGFPSMYDQRDLMSFFKVYGDIKKCTLVKASGDKPRHAYVTFNNMTSVEELKKEIDDSGGLYIRGNKLTIERTSDQIENAIRKRTEERKRKLDMGHHTGTDYHSKLPAVIEHKAGVAKPGLPLKEIKQKLDSVAKELSSYSGQKLSSGTFWALRKQWEWLNTTKDELNREAERELFSVPRSDGLNASTLAAAAHKLQEALEKLVDVCGTGGTSELPAKGKLATSMMKQTTENLGTSTQMRGSIYGNLPSGTTLTGTDWRVSSQSMPNPSTNWLQPVTNVSVPPPGFWGGAAQLKSGFAGQGVGPFMTLGQGYGNQQSYYVGSQALQRKTSTDNLQPVDMDVSDDEGDKETAGLKWSSSPGKGASFDPYRISVLGFTPLVQAKELQKMFTCYGLAKEVRIYLEHDIRYAFMTFRKQKAIKNLFKGKPGINLQMKDMKLICSRIQENKTHGPTARLLSEMVEEPPEPTAKTTAASVSQVIPLALPIPNQQFVILQLLANVEDLVSPPREKPLTEAEMLVDLQEREVRMVHSLQYQLGHENPERVVRIIKHLRCIHNDISIQRILFYLSREDVLTILCSTSKPELITAVQKFAGKIENAKDDATEINLYHLIRKMVLVINDVVLKKRPAYRDLYDVTVPGSTESQPIVIADSADTDTTPKEKTSRWSSSPTRSVASQLKSIYEAAIPSEKSSDSKTTTNTRSGGFVKQMSMDQKRKGLQKLLGELPSTKRQKVEDVFRTQVNKRRSNGEMVSEQEEINIYIEALGEIGKKTTLKEGHKSEGEHDKKHTEKDVPKHQENRTEKNVPKEEQKRAEKEKAKAGQKITVAATDNKGKSSSNGKISLEGLNLAEKRLRIQKALDEIPPFISSKIKSRQKISLTKMKGEGKQVSEVEELDSMAEAFNHMFNEEGNIMAHVLKDQIFKRKGDYRIRRDTAVKQLALPEFDEQVKRFRKLEQSKQAEEMKMLRESLSVLLKILLFKKQDKVFEGAEKSGFELSKVEKSIIRYQILLDMTQAVVTKREEKEKEADDIATGAYQPEKDQSEEDEFDDDNNVDNRLTAQEKEIKSQKRPLEETVEEGSSPKKGRLTEDEIDPGDKVKDGAVEKSTTNAVDDDDDDVQIVEEIEMSTRKEEEKDEVEKLLNEISSDEEEDVNIDDYDEVKLLEDIKETTDKDNDSLVDKGDATKDNQEIKDAECEVKVVGQTEGTTVSQDLAADTTTTNAKPIETSESNMSENGTDAGKLRDNAEKYSSKPTVESTEACGDKNDVAKYSHETEKSKEEKEAELETAFRQVLTPAQRRSILGRMTKTKKAKQAAGNELSDTEAADLRYQMIKEMLEKQAKS